MVAEVSRAGEVIERAKPLLDRRADELGHSDAAGLVAPSHPGCTPGELALRSAVEGLAVEVDRGIHADLAGFRTDHDAVQSALGHGDPDRVCGHSPDTAARSERVEPEWVLMGGLAAAELFTIHGPLETSIGAGPAAWLLAGMLALFAAVLAHGSAAHLAQASAATIPAVRDRARAGAYGLAGGVVLVGVVAALARIVNAWVLHQLFVATGGRAGERLDGWGVAFFVGFQAIFVLVNLALASREATRRLGRRMAPLRERARQLVVPVEDPAGWALSARREFWAVAADAVVTYRTTLAADSAMSPQWAHRWAERNSVELSDGTLLRRLFPGVAEDLLPPSACPGAGGRAAPGRPGRDDPAGTAPPPPAPPPPPQAPPPLRQQPLPEPRGAERPSGNHQAPPDAVPPGGAPGDAPEDRPMHPPGVPSPTPASPGSPPSPNAAAGGGGEDLIGDLAAL